MLPLSIKSYVGLDGDDENTMLMESFDQEATETPVKNLSPRGVHVHRQLGALFIGGISLALVLGLWTVSHWSHNAGVLPIASDLDLDPNFVVESTTKTRVYNWTVTQVIGAPVGVNKTMVVVNGRSPGPLIEANHNDRVVVYVKNGLADAGTSIHWHGLYQNHTNHFDGTTGITQCAIPPGETLVYNFTLDGWSGTTWWHGHTGMQHTDGLFGPIVVHKPGEKVPQYSEERVITLSDVYNDEAAGLLSTYLDSNSMETVPEPVPDSASINGSGQFSACYAFPDRLCNGGSYFNLTLIPGRTYRLRLINAGSFASLRFTVDKHELTVVEADGTPVAPRTVKGVTLHVAQRYSVLITTDQTPTMYWMRVTVDQSMFAYKTWHMQHETLGAIQYDSPEGAEAELTPGGEVSNDVTDIELIPADPLDAPSDVSHVIPFIFSIQRTYQENWRSFINGTSWELPSHGQATLVSDTARTAEDGTKAWPGDQLIASIDGVATVDFVINNLDDGDHPFHLHGYKPWIMGTARGRYKGSYLNTTNPMRRDTFFVPARSWMVIRVVTDTAGYWAFHCHIAWHMAGGGLFQVAVQPSSMSEIRLPDDIVLHCKSWLQ